MLQKFTQLYVACIRKLSESTLYPLQDIYLTYSIVGEVRAILRAKIRRKFAINIYGE